MSVVRTLIGNVKGPKGDTGSQGPQGVAGTIEIGSVQTVSYGSPASVTNSGTEEEAILDFQIPQGAPGAQVTDMSTLVLGAITDSTASYPAFAVNETGSTIFGKIRKFLSDLYNNTIKSGQVTTSTNVDEAGYVADARSIKSLNDSLANRLRFGIGSNGDNTSYPRAELKSVGNVSIGKTMTLRYSQDANNYTDAILCDKDGNLLPDYATKTELANCFPVPISQGGTGETAAWDAAKALGLETHSMGPGTVDTLTIVDNIALIAGMRGANAFLCLVTYWDSAPVYFYAVGKHPTITKTGNDDTFTITNDAGQGAYPILYITGTGTQHN